MKAVPDVGPRKRVILLPEPWGRLASGKEPIATRGDGRLKRPLRRPPADPRGDLPLGHDPSRFCAFWMLRFLFTVATVAVAIVLAVAACLGVIVAGIVGQFNEERGAAVASGRGAAD